VQQTRPSAAAPGPARHLSPLDAVLRRSGAAMVMHQGEVSAKHFGSSTSEVAACLTSVGISDRSRRATLEVRGTPLEVSLAVESLKECYVNAWWAEVGNGRVIVRSEPEDGGAVQACLEPFTGVTVTDVACLYAAIGLIGPLARDVLKASGPGAPGVEVFVVDDAPDRYELLTPVAAGPAMWDRLLRAGAPMHIACVGFEALEHLHAAHRGG